MKFYIENIPAGKPVTINASGRVFLIDSIIGGQTVDVMLLKNGSAQHILNGRKMAFKCLTDYDGVVLSSAVDIKVSFFISVDDVQIGVADGSSVSIPGGVKVTNTNIEPVPVLFTGTVEPVLGNVAVTNVAGAPIPAYFPVTPAVTVGNAAGAPIPAYFPAVPDVKVTNTNAAPVLVQQQTLATITDIAPVNLVTAGAAQALISDATLKRLRIRNSHATACVCIGGAGVTNANGAIKLQPGDVWAEDDCAGASWYAVSDTAATVIQLQGIK